MGRGTETLENGVVAPRLTPFSLLSLMSWDDLLPAKYAHRYLFSCPRLLHTSEKSPWDQRGITVEPQFFVESCSFHSLAARTK